MVVVNKPVQTAVAGTKFGDGLTFGVNYFSTHNHYEPYYLSNETLDRDFSLFQKQGLKYVTLALVWKYLEPKLGVYNEDALNDVERVCSFAQEYDLRVIINFYTMMKNDSWTMPEWLSPRKFEAVFLNSTARQAWLNYLDHCASRLNSSASIWSWHMMNEPWRQEWACNVSVDDFLQLWIEMKAVFRAYSVRPVSVRFAAQSFEDPNHFNNDPRIYDVMDYLALNWYEVYCSQDELVHLVGQAQKHTNITISEFGSNATEPGSNVTDKNIQAHQYKSYVELFRRLNLRVCIAWMWRADYVSDNPDAPGVNYNLASDVNGTANLAFYMMTSMPSPTPTPTSYPPTPTPTSTSTPTPSSAPTSIPSPTPMPTPTPLQSPLFSPSPTPSLEPTNSPTGFLPPEAVYAAAAIGTASLVIGIAILARATRNRNYSVEKRQKR
jgi:hypothetical protein